MLLALRSLCEDPRTDTTTLKRTSVTGQGGAYVTVVGVPASGLTYCGWFVVGQPMGAGTYATLICLEGQTGVTMSWVGIYNDTDVVTYASESQSAAIMTVAQGDLLHIAVVHDGATFVAHISKNGSSSIATAARAWTAGSTPTKLHVLSVLGIDPSMSSVNSPRVWSTPLTPGELGAERVSYSPVRGTDLWSAATLANQGAGLLDVSGNSREWVVSNLSAGSPNTRLTAKVVRAFTLISGVMSEIPIGALGATKPLVLLDGQRRLRAGSEGVPIVISCGRVRTLATDEVLEL